MVTDTPVYSGAGSLKDWYIQNGVTGATYSVGKGVFVDPDYAQTFTVATSSLPAWMSYNSAT